MKTTIINLLNKIANGEEPPKKIIYNYKLWEYDNQNKDYFTNQYDGTEWLFDEYVITDILNDELTIKPALGTIICYKKGETDNAGYVGVVDKINEDGSVCLKQNDKIEKILIKDMKIQATSTNNYWYTISQPMKIIINKINEIIDRINRE